MPRLLFLIAIVAGIPPAANADKIYVYGNVASCAQWSKYREHPAHAEHRMWLLGFITGSNFRSPESRQAVAEDYFIIEALVDRYCAKNPDRPLLAIAGVVVQELGGPAVEYTINK